MTTQSSPQSPSHGQPCATQRPATDIESARALFSAVQTQASAQGWSLRAPPPEPTTCCGRGCNGCVWEGFFEAAEVWRQDAVLQLSPARTAS